MFTFLRIENKIPWLFISIAFAFCALNLIIESINARFWLNDFQVYYSASENFLADGNPYGEAFGLSSGFFKYSPFTLLIFSPYTLFSFETAKFIHFAFISFATVFSVLGIYHLLNEHIFRRKVKALLFMILLLIISAVHLSREFHLGNVNMILILLLLTNLSFIINKKYLLAGFCFSIIFLLKPYFLILLLPLLVYRQWKFLRLFFAFSLILLILPILIVGWEGLETLHANWLDRMSAHSSHGFSEHTFISILHSYSGIQLKDYWQFIIIALTGLFYLLIRIKNFINKDNLNIQHLILDSFILLAIIPNLVITDSQHFLYTIPLIGYLLVMVQKNKSIWSISLFVILLFFYGANSNDLLGNPLSDAFDTYSTIGLANFGLILYTIILNRKTI